MNRIFSTIFMFLLFSTGVEAKNVISHKFLTKSIAKNLKNEIVYSDARKRYSDTDNSWRYESNRVFEQSSGDIQNNPLDIQIPLIWYHERF